MSQSNSGSIKQTTSMHLADIRLKTPNKYIFRALFSLASAALLTRIVGLLNQVIVTSRFGAGATMDAYFVASSVPLLLAGLLTGAMEASVIPVYTRVRSDGDKKQAIVLFSTMVNLLLIGSVLLLLVMLVFSRQLILVTAPGLDASRLGLADNLVPFIYPVLILMVLIGFLEDIFNAEGQFGWPAYAGLLVPLATVAFVLLLGPKEGVVVLCFGTVVGLCLQLCVFTIRARRAKLTYRPVLALRTPEIRLIMVTAAPVLLGSLISQGSPLVDQIFASTLAAGSISSLSYALKIISIFTGVIFASVGRAILPYLSRQSAARDMRSFKETLHLYLWMVGIVTTVMSIALIILARPLVQLLFQRGAFSSEDTERTVIILRGFLIGLTPMAFGFIVSRAFSALGRTRVLMGVSIFSVIANALFDAIFAHFWQGFGISLATSAVYACTMSILLFILFRMIGKINLFAPPSAIVEAFNKPGDNRYYRGWLDWKEKNISSSGLSANLTWQFVRVGMIVSVFALGIVAAIHNSLYTLRVSFGAIIILALLRYRYALLLSWVLLDAFIGSTLQIFNGNNFDTALTAPTVLLMLCMPLGQTLKRVPALSFLLLLLLWIFAGIGISSIGVTPFLTNWLLMLDYLAIAILTINVLSTQRRLMQLIDVIFIPATFIALYGIFGYVTKQNVIGDTGTSLRAASIYSASPGFALFLSLIIPLALYRIFTVSGRKRLVCILLVLIFLLATLLTFTRSAFISIPLSIILMILFLPSRRMKIRLLATMFLVVGSMLLLGTFGNVPIFNRFLNQDIGTLNGRTILWKALLDHFHPTQLLGNGLHASDALLTYLHIGINGQGLIANSPSNLFIGTLYDQGIIGLILLILVFVALAVNLYRGMRRSTGDQRALFIVALAVLVNMLIQSYDANDFWTQQIGLYFWIIVALPFANCWFQTKQVSSIDEEISYEATEPRLEPARELEGAHIF